MSKSCFISLILISYKFFGKSCRKIPEKLHDFYFFKLAIEVAGAALWRVPPGESPPTLSLTRKTPPPLFKPEFLLFGARIFVLLVSPSFLLKFGANLLRYVTPSLLQLES